jgi:hypothetical protein
MRTFTPEELVGRWEDKRDIKNLMGRYMLARQLQQESTMFEEFWCKEADTPIFANADGYYIGAQAIVDYYESLVKIDAFKAGVLYRAFPEKFAGKSEQDVLGIGDYDMDPVSTPLIEIAGDGKTAKGIWYSAGAGVQVGTSGPITMWSIGFYCCDFVRENDTWKLWHMVFCQELGFPGGQSWAEDPTAYPPLEPFAPLAEAPAPLAPTIAKKPWEPYSVRRKFVGTPRLPEPYETFSETFSYGL